MRVFKGGHPIIIPCIVGKSLDIRVVYRTARIDNLDFPQSHKLHLVSHTPVYPVTLHKRGIYRHPTQPDFTDQASLGRNFLHSGNRRCPYRLGEIAFNVVFVISRHLEKIFFPVDGTLDRKLDLRRDVVRRGDSDVLKGYSVCVRIGTAGGLGSPDDSPFRLSASFDNNFAICSPSLNVSDINSASP